MSPIVSIPWGILPTFLQRPGPVAARRARARGRRRPAASPWFLEPMEGRVVPAVIPVMTLADAGPGSLRAAITQANLDAAPDTITFDPAVRGTISLASALPELATAIDIEGPGASALTVARNALPGTPTFRVVTVPAGAVASIAGLTVSGGSSGLVPGAIGGIYNAGVLTVSDSTISGGGFAAGHGDGGGIYNVGSLTVSDSTISGNSTNIARGGGIYNAGSLTVSDSTISGNSTGSLTGGGGGVYNVGSLTVIGSTISGNTAGGLEGFGGGIYNTGSLTVTGSVLNLNRSGLGGGIYNAGSLRATVTGSTISGNTARAATSFGGGIYNVGSLAVSDAMISGNSGGGVFGLGGGGIYNAGSLTVTGSTISGNSCGTFFPGSGGGVYNVGSLTVTNSTISGNSANSRGGGIYNAGVLTVEDSTISDNSTSPGSESGGGIYNVGSLTVTMSIFANTDGGNLHLDPAPGSAFTSLGHKLFSDTPGVLLHPTDLTGTDPKLGPLSNNGGPTMTQALLPGSPALDAGVAVPGIITDQRGVHRPQGTAPDIGAFEAVVGSPPQVVGLRRDGVHLQPTRVVITFSAAMDPASAQDVDNYMIVPAGPAGRVRPHARPIPVALAVYDPVTHAVTLAPRGHLTLHGYYRLTVSATPPNGLKSAAGVPLDGSGQGIPTSAYVALIHGFGTVAPVRFPVGPLG